jgi:hypothetical protein
MTEKKQTAPNQNATTKPKPLHIVRSGEVVISISERQSNSGYSYQDLTLTREWTSQATGKRVHGSPFFFAKHEEDLIKAIRRAAAWLRGSQATPTTEDANEPSEDYEDEARKLASELEQDQQTE